MLYHYAFFASCAIALFAAVDINSPKSAYRKALLKSKDHFIAYSLDGRILYEPGAEEHAAKFAEFLPEAIRIIKEGQHNPFKKAFKVYVCSSQKSHNEFVAHPSLYPIRGTVLLGNVFTAPSAFDFQNMDTHRETLLHELSHLHLLQHLGFVGYRKIPIWFTEGLANCLAGSGGEGISDDEAIHAIMSGRHFTLREEGGLFRSWPKVVYGAGLKPRMFHKQNRMFVKFLMNRDPSVFAAFLSDILRGASFFECFDSHFQTNPEEILKEMLHFCAEKLK